MVPVPGGSAPAVPVVLHVIPTATARGAQRERVPWPPASTSPVSVTTA